MGHETPLTFFPRKFNGHRWGHEKLFCKIHWPWNDVHGIFNWFSWDCHKSQFHSALNLVRLRYWIPAGRQHVKKAINHGVTCKTIIGLAYNIPTNLFFQRKDTQEEPFTVSDVDFTRALYIREAVAEKRDYIYFFTCLRADVSYFLKEIGDVCTQPTSLHVLQQK